MNHRRYEARNPKHEIRNKFENQTFKCSKQGFGVEAEDTEERAKIKMQNYKAKIKKFLKEI